MEKISSYNYVNQIYIFSIAGLVFSSFLGLGLIFLIPSLVFSYNIKKNYLKYDVSKVDKSIIYSLSGILLSIVCIILEVNLFF